MISASYGYEKSIGCPLVQTHVFVIESPSAMASGCSVQTSKRGSTPFIVYITTTKNLLPNKCFQVSTITFIRCLNGQEGALWSDLSLLQRLRCNFQNDTHRKICCPFLVGANSKFHRLYMTFTHL